MHHQLAKRAVIVVIIISVYPCPLRRNNQCMNQWSRQVYIPPPPSDVLYLIKKIWREKASQEQNEIVTFAGNYIVSIYLPLTKLEDFFLY